MPLNTDDEYSARVDAVRGSGLRRVVVPMGDAEYSVVIGSGAADSIEQFLPKSTRRVAVISSRGLPSVKLPHSIATEIFLVDEGERSKEFGVVARLCSELANFGLSRTDLIVAVGGGVICDLAGFVASIYYRGIRHINVATSLLAMVDAAVGGKTGIDIPEGKNLVGTFWQPIGVLCDTDHLATLPTREWLCGLGEMAKYSLMGEDLITGGDLLQQVERAVSIKASVVAADEREGAGRATLNYGHTLAHAIETQGLLGDGDIRHGEAVAIGLVFAAELAAELGRISRSRVDFHREVLASLGLSWRLPEWVDRDGLLPVMMRDKKASGSLTFVLDGSNGLEVVRDVEPERVMGVLRGF